MTRAIVIAVSLALATRAHAQEAAQDTPPVTRTEVVAPRAAAPAVSMDPRRAVTPTFEITGKSDGEDTLRLGVDWLRPLLDEHEIHLKLALEASSHDGVATLLSGTSSGFETESFVAGSLDVMYTQLQRAIAALDKTSIDVTSVAERRALLRQCMAEDPRFVPRAHNPAARFSITSDADVDGVDPGEFCPSAQRRLAALDPANERTLPVPLRQLSLSVSAGRGTFRQLSPAGEPMVFRATSVHKPRFAVSAAYAQYVPASRLSLELATRLASSYAPSSRKARWCVPAGAVSRDTGTDPAESCSELPLGDPSRTTSLAIAGYAGFVGDDYNWRVAIGPVARFGSGGDEVSYDVGLELPLYLVRASPGFSGIVRVAPAALITRDAEGVEDIKLLLTVTLLGGRTLLDAAFH